MNQIAPIGHNNPPEEETPVELALEEFADYFDEAENWLDGEAIDTVEQMEAVDELIAKVRKAGTSIRNTSKIHTDPLHKAWKAEVAIWNNAKSEIDTIKAGLVNLVAPIKKRLHDEAELEKKLAWEAARAAEAEAAAAAAAAQADDTNIDALRDAEDATFTAKLAVQEAKQTAPTKVKGMRTVHKHKVESGQKVIDWIIKNDVSAIQLFIKNYVEKSKDRDAIDGVRTWTQKEPY